MWYTNSIFIIFLAKYTYQLTRKKAILDSFLLFINKQKRSLRVSLLKTDLKKELFNGTENDIESDSVLLIFLEIYHYYNILCNHLQVL